MPVRAPSVPMKPLWWQKLLLGSQIHPGDTIWDQVPGAVQKWRALVSERVFKSAAFSRI